MATLFLICGRLDPQKLLFLLPVSGRALGGKQQVAEAVEVAAHLAVHELLLNERHHGALRAAADGARKVKVRGAQAAGLSVVLCGRGAA